MRIFDDDVRCIIMDERSVVTMSKDFSVHVEHVTRVEGHGNIILNVKNVGLKNFNGML